MIHFESMSRRNWQREYLEYLIGSINRKEINSKELVCLSTTIDLRPRNAQSIRRKKIVLKMLQKNSQKYRRCFCFMVSNPTTSWLHKVKIGKQKYLLHQKMLIPRNGNKNTLHRNKTKN